ncbi:DMT family transporter [Nocardia farcinica]|uniref:DMT family transporter n=1 Tax=Nocardia farcinica TaxID=37329 RepID=UPI002456AD29|nr:DMT family transporter [Nocardia farcinica]
MKATGRAVALLIAATTLWGASSAWIATITAPSAGSAAPVAAGGALSILAFCLVRGERPWRVFAADRRLFLLLGLLEMANLVLYVAALRLGPLPVVVALHLTSPVLIIVTHVLTGRRRFGLAVAVELLLVATAIMLVATDRADSNDTGSVAAGCVLAVASAACVAGLVTLVARHSAGRSTAASAGLQLLMAAGFCVPPMVVSPPAAAAAAELTAVGAILLGPGFACYWWALETADATTAGIIGLNEAVAAASVGALLTGTSLTVTTLFAGALVLMAVAVQVRSGAPHALPPRTPHRPAGPCHPSRSRRRC